jgi:hypothetical protein
MSLGTTREFDVQQYGEKWGKGGEVTFLTPVALITRIILKILNTPKGQKPHSKYAWRMDHGDVIVMGGGMQHSGSGVGWKHGVHARLHA